MKLYDMNKFDPQIKQELEKVEQLFDLEEQIDNAVKVENYEMAAVLRDKIINLKKQGKNRVRKIIRG